MKYSKQARLFNCHHTAFVILAILAAIAPACQTATPLAPASTATPFDIAERQLRRQQQKWQDVGISHYRFQLFRGCICEDNEEVLIEVVNRQILSLEHPSGKGVSEYDRAEFESWGTMDRLFSTVESELAGESLEVIVTYDPNYGFPVEVMSECSVGSDDELHLIVSDFEVLP